MINIFRKRVSTKKIRLRGDIEIDESMLGPLRDVVFNLCLMKSAEPRRFAAVIKVIYGELMTLIQCENFLILWPNDSEDLTANNPSQIITTARCFAAWIRASLELTNGAYEVVCPVMNMNLDDFLREE